MAATMRFARTNEAMMLTAIEVVDLTGGKKRCDAQARELTHMGIPFVVRSDGSLAVLRSVVELALGGGVTTQPPPPKPEPYLMP
jgi:hypothetical protein